MRNPNGEMRKYNIHGALLLDPEADALREWDTDASNLVKEAAAKHREALQTDDPVVAEAHRSDGDNLLYEALMELAGSAGTSVHTSFLKALVTRLVELETRLLMK